jgi:hypothetical protein
MSVAVYPVFVTFSEIKIPHSLIENKWMAKHGGPEQIYQRVATYIAADTDLRSPVGAGTSPRPYEVRLNEIASMNADQYEQRIGRICQHCEPRDVATALLGPCFQYAFMRHFLGKDPLGQSEEEFVAGMLVPLLTGLTTATD